jgi:ATP-binding cassette subfamily F protein 3
LEKPIEQRAMSLRIKGGARSGNIVLETVRLQIGYRDSEPGNTGDPERQGPSPSSRCLFACPDLILLRTERAALIGPNGTGKTTFLKTILGEVAPLAGEARIGANVKLGYFAQAHEGLNLDNTVLQELMAARDDLKLSEARDILGRFLFSGDDQFKRVGMLSGGERGRVALAKLTLQGANFLLLDEPTNHLDIPSQEVLTEALQHFEGTLLLVSHDRYLVAALATQLWILDRGARGATGMTVFRGTYDAWLEARDEAREGRGQAGAGAEPKADTPPANLAPSAESKNRQQQRVARLEAAERRIEVLEKRLSELSWAMEAAGSDFARVQALAGDYAQVERDLADAWAEFERIV